MAGDIGQLFIIINKRVDFLVLRLVIIIISSKIQIIMHLAGLSLATHDDVNRFAPLHELINLYNILR